MTAEDARLRFVDALVFNRHIGATDGNAKDVGLLLSGSRARFAPLYDIASMLPYEHDAKQLELAMKIGGEYRFKAIGPRSWEKLPDAIADAAAAEDVTALHGDLPSRLIDRVTDHAGRCCTSIERQLARQALNGSPSWRCPRISSASMSALHHAPCLRRVVPGAVAPGGQQR